MQLRNSLPFITYGIAAFLTFIVVEEDAFIYFRLAQNMADGYGIVFNRGGEHIESGSGLIWQLLLAFIAMLPVHLVIATKFLGVLFACLSLWMLLRLSDRFIDDKRFVIFPALLLACSTPFYYWSHRGLETTQFVFVLLWLCDWLTDKNKIHRWYLPAFMVFCSRPEGFLMVAAVLPWLWMERRNITSFWKGVGIFLALCVALFAWRLWYFHDLLPHAFYQKIGGDLDKSLYDLWRYGLWNGLWFLLLPALLIMVKTKSWQRDYIPLLLLLAVTSLWGVIGADWKSFNRQLSSWLPFLFLLGIMGVSKTSQASLFKKGLLVLLGAYSFYIFAYSPYTASTGQVRPAPNFVCLQLFFKNPVKYIRNVVSATVQPEQYFKQKEPTLAGDHIGFNRNATVGRFIQLNYPENITVIFDQMGQAPWYAGLDKRFIDNTGLTDKQIGYFAFQEKATRSAVFGVYQEFLLILKKGFWPEETYQTSKKKIIDRLFAEKAELVLVRERYIQNQPNSILGLMVRDTRFAENYREAYRINRRDRIFERRDLPVLFNPQVPPGASVEKLVKTP